MEGPAPHELLENSELTNSPVGAGGATRVAEGATRVAQADRSVAGKGGKMGREANLTREDAGSVFKQLDDPKTPQKISRATSPAKVSIAERLWI
jgi:hypothetical protein